MARCKLCKRNSAEISKALSLCLACIRQRPRKALEITEKVHGQSRLRFGLPAKPPNDSKGVPCRVCMNNCRIPENETGYCGLRRNQNGHLQGASSRSGKLSWYHDPLPTNCVADRVCPGGTGSGFPRYAHCRGPESGFKNLAVFFQGCSFNCLFCQNWHFRNETFTAPSRAVEDLVADVDERTSCICYFGGDPAPQTPFSLKASSQARQKASDKILRICWETNGSVNPNQLDQMMKIAMDSGGCVKFDLKARDPVLHRVLTGVSNRATFSNFVRAAEKTVQRPVPPLLIASTLLVPGYIDPDEVAAIAEFIFGLDPAIPYNLLAYHPQFLMSDIPVTSQTLAKKCLQAARDCGLTRVRLGNEHLLM
jgi:pyruvate formate lyase activating enzyme